jgi:hypothetical protein
MGTRMMKGIMAWMIPMDSSRGCSFHEISSVILENRQSRYPV